MPTEPESLHLQCRHIFPDGHRCGSKCLRHEPFCYYHHTTRRPRTGPPLANFQPDTLATFDLPLPDDRSSIQAAIGLILQRLAGGGLDTKRAGLLLYGLQIASMNLPKPSLTPIESVDEVIEDETHGPIAPIAEMYRAPHEKTLEEIIMEGWNRQDDRNPPFPGAIYRPAVPAAWLQPETIDLQAVGAPCLAPETWETTAPSHPGAHHLKQAHRLRRARRLRSIPSSAGTPATHSSHRTQTSSTTHSRSSPSSARSEHSSADTAGRCSRCSSSAEPSDPASP